MIDASWRERLHEYLGGTVGGLGGVVQGVGGVADHVHSCRIEGHTLSRRFHAGAEEGFVRVGA